MCLLCGVVIATIVILHVITGLIVLLQKKVDIENNNGKKETFHLVFYSSIFFAFSLIYSLIAMYFSNMSSLFNAVIYVCIIWFARSVLSKCMDIECINVPKRKLCFAISMLSNAIFLVILSQVMQDSKLYDYAIADLAIVFGFIISLDDLVSQKGIGEVFKSILESFGISRKNLLAMIVPALVLVVIICIAFCFRITVPKDYQELIQSGFAIGSIIYWLLNGFLLLLNKRKIIKRRQGKVTKNKYNAETKVKLIKNELKNELKKAEKEYYNSRKLENKKIGIRGKLKRVWNFTKDIVYSLRPMETYSSCDEQLYIIFVEEIRTFYNLKDLSREQLQLCKYSLEKEEERKISIIAPIILSVIASLLYTAIFTDLLPCLKNLMGKWCIAVLDYIEIFTKIDIIYEFFLVPFWVMLIIVIVAYIVFKALFVIAYLIGGYSTLAMAKKFEMEFIDELLREKSVGINVIQEKLDAYSNKFFDIVNLIIFNELIRSNKDYLEENEVKNIVRQSIIQIPELHKIQQYTYGVSIVEYIVEQNIQEIPYRSNKLRFREHKVFLK